MRQLPDRDPRRPGLPRVGGRVVELPAQVSDRSATVLEPVAVATHLLDRIGAYPGLETVAHVIGGGPLGVLLAQTLGAGGWTVTVHEPLAYRRRIASELGLTAVGTGTAPTAPAGESVLVVETSAAPSGVELARGLASPGSVVALIGRAPADVPSAEILLRELSVAGVRSGSGCYERAIALVASGAVRPEQVVTHEFDVGDIAAGMALAADPASQVMRSVVHFGGAGQSPVPQLAGACL